MTADRFKLMFVLLSMTAACGGAPSTEEGGRVHVAVAALVPESQRVEYDMGIWEVSETGGTRTIYLPAASPNGPGGDFSGVYPCVAGTHGSVEVTVRIFDRETGAILDTLSDEKLFECIREADAAAEFHFRSRGQASAGFVDVSITVESVDVSFKADVREVNGEWTAITGLAIGADAAGKFPEVYYLAEARDTDGMATEFISRTSAGTTEAGDLSYFDVQLPWGQAPAGHKPYTILTGQVYLFPAGASDVFQTGSFMPTYSFEEINLPYPPLSHVQPITNPTAKAASQVASVLRRSGGVTAVGGVRNVEFDGGLGLKSGALELAGSSAAKPGSISGLSTQVYRADPAVFPSGIRGTGAISFGKGEFGVMVRGVAEMQDLHRVAWCSLTPASADGTGGGNDTALKDDGMRCDTDQAGFLVLNSIEDSLARAGATQGQ